jgi:diacylglycerol kinase family enzyme
VLAIILNTSSGKGPSNGAAGDLKSLFEASGLPARFYEVRESGALSAAIGDAVREKPDAMIAAGGDGTVSAVAGALAGSAIPLGVLPLGTLNHFAKDLAIPHDAKAAVGTIAAGHLKAVDVGRLNDRVFINNSSLGVYPSIVERRDRLRAAGHRKWPSFVRATLEVLQDEEEMFVRLDTGGQRVVSRTPFLFVGNNAYRVEGVRLGARRRLDEGVLCACYAPPVRTRDLPRLLAKSLLGVARSGHSLESVTAGELWVDTLPGRTVQVACDGEVLQMKAPLHYRICPGELNVIAPEG